MTKAATDTPDPGETPETSPESGRVKRLTRRLRREHPPLALWVRVCLFLVAWFLILLGIAGLFLPFLQGFLFIFLGAAVLSLVSEIAYELLRKSLAPWPWTWRRVATWRRKIRHKVVHWTHKPKPPDPPADD